MKTMKDALVWWLSDKPSLEDNDQLLDELRPFGCMHCKREHCRLFFNEIQQTVRVEFLLNIKIKFLPTKTNISYKNEFD